MEETKPFESFQLNQLLRKMINFFEALKTPHTDATCWSEWCKSDKNLGQTCKYILFKYYTKNDLVTGRACELSGENSRSPLTWVFASTAQSHSRPLRSFPLPAHLQFHPAPVKSLHARSHLKFLCMPNTCRFQPKPWDTLSAWRTWSGFVA